VVWQGSAGDRRPYADQTALPETINPAPGDARRLVAGILERLDATSEQSIFQ